MANERRQGAKLKKHRNHESHGAQRNTAHRGTQYINARTGQPYSGPTHQHNGRHMVGQYHTNEPHDYVTKVNSGNNMNQFNPYEMQLIHDGQVMSVHDCVKCGNAMGQTGQGGNVTNCVRCVDHMSAL